MDPNETLVSIRALTAKIIELSDKDDEDLAIEGLELAEAAQALDEWLTKGGFLPSAWKASGKDRSGELCSCGHHRACCCPCMRNP